MLHLEGKNFQPTVLWETLERKKLPEMGAAFCLLPSGVGRGGVGGVVTTLTETGLRRPEWKVTAMRVTVIILFLHFYSKDFEVSPGALTHTLWDRCLSLPLPRP